MSRSKLSPAVAQALAQCTEPMSLGDQLESAKHSLARAERDFEAEQERRRRERANLPIMHIPLDAASTVQPMQDIRALRKIVAELEDQIAQEKASHGPA